MNREEFEKIIADKGWTPLLLGQRWSLSDRRIRMIKAELSEAKPYYKDAVRGLHKLSSSPDESEITRYSGFTAKQLRAVYEKKGWDIDSISERWGFAGKSGLYAFISRNPSLASDAIHGLPEKDSASAGDEFENNTMSVLRAIFEAKGWKADELATRWGYQSVTTLYGFFRRNPAMATDAVNGLPEYQHDE